MSAPQTIDDRLDALLADHFQRLDRGEAASPTSLIAAHPELADELREFFDAARFVEDLAGPTHGEQTQLLSVHDTARNSLIGETIVSGVQPHPARGALHGGRLPAHFGRYHVERLLGQGAMGSVYLAHDPQLDRPIALKIPKLAEDNPDMQQRFLREARSASNLRHANICPVYDVGRLDGVHYITMAYIEGRTLADELRGGRTFTAREIATIVRKLALALSKAHAAHVVHRDLKPGNIMLDGEGEPVLMDFGLAYREQTDELRLTKSGMIVGSPAYMSPEQIDGDPTKIGAASDIYSLGVVLYEMITGKLPFQGSMMSVIGQIASKEPTPVGHWRPELANSPLELLCRKMMAKHPQQRPASMQDVASALEFVLSGLRQEGERGREGEREITRAELAPAAVSLPVAKFPPPPLSPSPTLPLKYPEAVLAQERRDRAKMFLATTLILLVALGFFGAMAGIVYVATDGGTLEITSQVDEIEIEVTDENGQVVIRDPVTGTQVKRLRSGDYKIKIKGDRTDVMLDPTGFKMTRGGKAIVTAIYKPIPPSTAINPQSPLAAGAPRPPSDVPMDGVQPIARLTDHKTEVRGVAFSPDDKQFVTVGWDRMIHLYDTATRQIVRSWQGDAQGLYRGRFLPDGRLLTSGYEGNIVLWDVDKAKEIKRLTGHVGPVTGLAVSADGKRAVSSGHDETIRLWDLEKLEPIRTMQKIEGGQWPWDVAIAPGGQSAASVGFDGKIRFWNLETGEPTGEIAAHQGAALAIAYLGEGRVISGGRDGALRLWDTNANKVSEYTDFPGVWIENLSVSPDGQRVLVALANPDKQESQAPLAGRCALFHVESWLVEGFLPTGAPYVYSTAFSADGSLILTGGGRGDPAPALLWRLDDLVPPPAAIPATSPTVNREAVPELKEATRLPGHNGPVFGLAVTADGTSALSVSDDYFVRQWDLKTNQQQREIRATGALRCIAFSPDGQRVAWSGGQKTITLWDLKENKELKSLAGHKNWVYGLQFTKDGRRLLSISRDKTVRLWNVESGASVLELETIDRQDIVARLSPDETKILASSDNFYTLSVWNVADGQKLLGLHGHGVEGVYAAAWSPDATQIATADGRGFLLLRDAATGEPTVTFRAHDDRITALEFTPDGRHLVSGGFDKALCLWDAKTGQLVARTLADHRVTNNLVVLPGGKQVLSGGGWHLDRDGNFMQEGDYALRLWDLPASVATLTKPQQDAPLVPPAAAAPFDAARAGELQQAWADHLGVPVEHTNAAGMKFRLIPPGEFDMGSGDEVLTQLQPQAEWFFAGWSSDRRRKEMPRRRVHITRPFYLGAHEVTRADFRKFVEASAYQPTAEKERKGGPGYVQGEWKLGQQYGWSKPGFEQGENHPVCNIAWEDAAAFCSWLGEQGSPCRLPTEAEWEYACRAGTTTLFSTGDEVASLEASANVADKSLAAAAPQVAWNAEWDDGHPTTAPVGTLRTNAFGLYDMHGNVSEWCLDWMDQYNPQLTDDPRGPQTGQRHVFRGGAFDNWAGFARSADRYSSHSPTLRTDWAGFRVVLSVDGVKSQLSNTRQAQD